MLPATSGKLKNNEIQPYLQYKEGGPLPESMSYWVLPSEIEYFERAPLEEQFWAVLGRGNWRGGTDSWGSERVKIHYENVYIGDRTGGFYIHGGTTPGSAGCIDLGDGSTWFIRQWLQYQQGPIRLIVNY